MKRQNPSPTRIALVGCGVISNAHLKAFAAIPEADIVALCDLSPESLKRAGDAFGIERRTASASELFDDPGIDGVILAIPTGARTAVALQALAAGKHTLLEKPAAMNKEEIEQIQAARGDRVVACCSARFSHYPSSVAAREFLRSGKLGAIRTIACRAAVPPRKPAPANPPPWRLSRKLNGGGILVNWGSYDLDFLFSLLDFDLQPVHVLAQTWQVPPANAAYAAPGSDAETHVNALVTFQNGSVFDYERTEFAAIPGEQRWQISGENGTLALRLLPGREDRLVWWQPDAAEGTREKIVWEGDQSAIDHTTLVDENYVAAIRGEAKPFTCLRKSGLIQRVTDAIYASADSGRPVTLNENPLSQTAQ